MNFANTWYIIERNGHFETISHEKLCSLEPGSFIIFQNFKTHHDAHTEHMRLVRLSIDETKEKIGKLN